MVPNVLNFSVAAPNSTSGIQTDFINIENHECKNMPTNNKVISKLLIVDDATMNRKMLIRAIENKVDEIIEANDGLDAIEKVRESITNNEPFDVILMDFVMPNMDGPDATRIIRSTGFTGIVLGVTGNALDFDIDTFKNHGANDVLPKPLDLNKMERVLKSKISIIYYFIIYYICILLLLYIFYIN
jgi:CheY-like chemotaxis protein